MVVIFVRELMMLSNLCVVPGDSASNVQEVIVFETLLKQLLICIHSYLYFALYCSIFQLQQNQGH